MAASKTKLVVEAGLALSGAALGAAGAVLIEPAIIGLGVAAAVVGAVMRYNDAHGDIKPSNKVDNEIHCPF